MPQFVITNQLRLTKLSRTKALQDRRVKPIFEFGVIGLFLKPLKAMDGFQERHGCEQRVLKITQLPQIQKLVLPSCPGEFWFQP